MIEVLKSPQSKFENFQKVDVSFRHHTGTLSLNSILPDFWTVVQRPNARVHTEFGGKRVVIPADYFKLPGDTISLLHEIGHAVIDETKDEDWLERDQYLRDKFTYDGPELFTREERADYEQIVLGSEKEGWRFALEKYRELRSIGINLEPELEEIDLMKLVEQKLSTYFIKT